VPVSRFTKLSEAHYELDVGRGTIQIDLVALGVTLDAGQVEKLRAAVQGLIDERIRLRDLPDDDPAKTTDPARLDFFWEGQGGNRTLVARPVEVVVRWRPGGGGFDWVFRRPGDPIGFMDL
jgi:hypothetical protein